MVVCVKFGFKSCFLFSSLQWTPQWHLPFLFFCRNTFDKSQRGKATAANAQRIFLHNWTNVQQKKNPHIILNAHRFIQQKVGHAVEQEARMFPEIWNADQAFSAFSYRNILHIHSTVCVIWMQKHKEGYVS